MIGPLGPMAGGPETGAFNRCQISSANLSFHMRVERKFPAPKINTNMVDSNADMDDPEL